MTDLRGPKAQIRSTAFLHFLPCRRLSSWALSPAMASRVRLLTSRLLPSLRDRFTCSRVRISSELLSSRLVTSGRKQELWLLPGRRFGDGEHKLYLSLLNKHKELKHIFGGRGNGSTRRKPTTWGEHADSNPGLPGLPGVLTTLPPSCPSRTENCH